ncbi:MAG TPA: flagellar hook-basal body complex protein FliE [Phycisphaerales bacterium]|nr:flagellar hook-basal body complex protein FliE [Phycisphaerales bacterium]
MADPLGFINPPSSIRPVQPPAGGLNRAPGPDAGGASFKDVLLDNLRQANDAQVEATRAVEDLQTGDRTDIEGVILATQKADNAFRMLQSLRNRMMEAYDEVKQMRV